MVRPGGDVLSLRAYVQLPQHVSDELLHVLMATVVEGDARALSVGQWCAGHDPIRVDEDGLIVRLRELHECHERSILPVGRASRARRPATCDARASRSHDPLQLMTAILTGLPGRGSGLPLSTR